MPFEHRTNVLWLTQVKYNLSAPLCIHEQLTVPIPTLHRAGWEGHSRGEVKEKQNGKSNEGLVSDLLYFS